MQIEEQSARMGNFVSRAYRLFSTKAKENKKKSNSPQKIYEIIVWNRNCMDATVTSRVTRSVELLERQLGVFIGSVKIQPNQANQSYDTVLKIEPNWTESKFYSVCNSVQTEIY